MHRHRVVVAAAVLGGVVASGVVARLALATEPEVLAFAGFEGDAVGATARPYGPPTVEEELYDDSIGSGGVSAVESSGGGRRYRLAESASGGSRGVRLPLSEEVSSGTITFSAVLSADQVAAGGVFTVVGPDEPEWFVRVSFGDDGRIHCHGESTDLAYSSAARYAVQAVLRFGTSTTVDYDIAALAAPYSSVSVHDCPVTLTGTVDAIRFATDAGGQAGFAVDDLQAVR